MPPQTLFALLWVGLDLTKTSHESLSGLTIPDVGRSWVRRTLHNTLDTATRNGRTHQTSSTPPATDVWRVTLCGEFAVTRWPLEVVVLSAGQLGTCINIVVSANE